MPRALAALAASPVDAAVVAAVVQILMPPRFQSPRFQFQSQRTLYQFE